MDALLIGLGGVLSIVAVIPYIIAVLRGRVKPRVVSWFTWGLLSGMACIASFADGQLASGVLLLCSTLAVLAVACLGLGRGDRHVERLDIVCQSAALVGIALWLIFNSPAVAVVAAATIDLVGAIPTFKHSWQKPHEEAWITFALSCLGAVCALLAVDKWEVTGVAYLLYLVGANAAMTVLILLSPKRRQAGGPPELREL